MAKYIDRPTPFTLSGVGRFYAKRNRLNTVIFLKDIQAAYLETVIDGGVIDSTITPVLRNVRLNQYGNIRGKRQKGLQAVAGRARSKFVGEVMGVYGAWQRYGPGGSRLKLLAKLERNANRRAVWPAYEVARKAAEQRLDKDIGDALETVIARL